MSSSQYEKDRALCEKLHGEHIGTDLVAKLQKVCADYVAITEWAFAAILARPVLPLETRVLLLLACCICREELPAQVKAYAEAALGLGLSEDVITETILQTLPIAGFPAVTNAMVTVEDVLKVESAA